MTSQPRDIPGKVVPLQIPLSSASFRPLSSTSKLRNSFLLTDTFSPVNQNGSFEFDRVLKNGPVLKRTRKTKGWKPVFLVLRPNYLSMYRDEKEDKLRHKIHLADLTAVAFLKDPKHKRENVIGLFTPSRNYHLETASKQDAQEWVDIIRREARIEEEEEEMLLASPGGDNAGSYTGFERAMQERRRWQDERLNSSSPEPFDHAPLAARRKATGLNMTRTPSNTIEYSGNELGSHSDMSEAETSRNRGLSFVSMVEDHSLPKPSIMQPAADGQSATQSGGAPMEQDPERVVWQGHLLYLKTKGGVRQWKNLWVVLRPRNVTFYKDDSEYSPSLIISMSSVINVVEVDPLSKTKRNCLQIITEEKSYKFCAHDEETWDKSLGAFKSLLAKRKEHDQKRSFN